ncbi:MAG: DUF4166 domain-containing protein [Nevskia sp.]|nr:DUF4166 domain-containing protein [Nevskia sp.]
MSTPALADAEQPAATDTNKHRRHPGIDFAALVGGEGWRRLAPDIRRRFSEHPAPDRPIRYAGTMHKVECSRPGLALAWLCRLIGTPFTPYRGRYVPVSITLHHHGEGSVRWERDYRYPGRRPLRVTSVKRSEAGTGLVECVGFGLGMRLAVFEANGELHFLSLRYFFTLGRRRIPLPRLLTPGTAHVIHADLGHGRFRFAMTFHHDWLGTLFHQDGVFHQEPGATQ